MCVCVCVCIEKPSEKRKKKPFDVCFCLIVRTPAMEKMRAKKRRRAHEKKLHLNVM